MDSFEVLKEKGEKVRQGMVHFVLSRSYSMFLFAVVLGALSDIVFPNTILSGVWFQSVGFVCIMLGSLLIYWAQKMTRCGPTNMPKDIVELDFEKGPYKYTRNPTHIGLTVMTLGLAFVVQSFFMLIFVSVIAIVGKVVFVRRQELLLEKKYGKAYCDYKKKVRSWI